MTPRMVRTVEELRTLDVRRFPAVLDKDGNPRSASEMQAAWSDRSITWALPATVLAPAFDPDDEALVERMAQAACNSSYSSEMWSAFNEATRSRYRDMIRAALKAVAQ